MLPLSRRRLLLFVALLLPVAPCPAPAESPTPASSPSAGSKVEKKEYVIQSTGRKIQVYWPKSIGDKKLPCVLIGAAGSRLFHGVNLVEEDSAEHYPYAKAGFAVVAYEISGPLTEEDLENEAAILKAATDFTKSHGGIDDAKAALALAASKHAFIDLKRVYAVGHSSAATVALTLAQDSPEIRACVAYAPVVDLLGNFPEPMIAAFEQNGVKFRDYLTANSPMTHINDLKCPLFLFVAMDDGNIPPKLVREYAAKVKTAGKPVDYKEVPDGNHYDSMIEQGIPAGIAWLKKLDKTLAAPEAKPAAKSGK